MRVFTLIDCYLPGFRHGGPIRTVANLAEQAPDDIEFWIFTRNKDRGSSEPYPGVPYDEWVRVGPAMVCYATRNGELLPSLIREVKRIRPDLLYANSLFSSMTTRMLVARRLGLLRQPLLLAPRGELAKAALALKRWKKAPYLALARKALLSRNIHWQASTVEERGDIEREIGLGGVRISVARDVVGSLPVARSDFAGKTKGVARFAFLSRITAMKNLPYAIQCMASVRGRATFDIFGPKDDGSSWEESARAIAKLPANIKAKYRGSVNPADVVPTLKRYHFFVLPTRGENFGHVIFEALSAGCPVVCSNRTSWGDISSTNAGWILPLEQPQLWTAAFQECIDMGSDEYARRSESARRLAERVAGAEAVEATVELLRTAGHNSGTP